MASMHILRLRSCVRHSIRIDLHNQRNAVYPCLEKATIAAHFLHNHHDRNKLQRGKVFFFLISLSNLDLPSKEAFTSHPYSGSNRQNRTIHTVILPSLHRAHLRSPTESLLTALRVSPTSHLSTFHLEVEKKYREPRRMIRRSLGKYFPANTSLRVSQKQRLT